MAVVILSIGLVAIYKAFFLSLDYSNHLTLRLNANVLLDEKISYIEYLFKEYQQLPLGNTQELERVVIHNKQVDFIYEIDFTSVDGLNNIFQLDISLSWAEGERKIRLSRSVYIFSYKQIA